MTPIEATALKATKLLREKSAMQSKRRADTQLVTKGVLVAAGNQWRKPLRGSLVKRDGKHLQSQKRVSLRMKKTRWEQYKFTFRCSIFQT
jgi:hypothetical protein